MPSKHPIAKLEKLPRRQGYGIQRQTPSLRRAITDQPPTRQTNNNNTTKHRQPHCQSPTLLQTNNEINTTTNRYSKIFFSPIHTSGKKIQFGVTNRQPPTRAGSKPKEPNNQPANLEIVHSAVAPKNQTPTSNVPDGSIQNQTQQAIAIARPIARTSG